MGVSLDVVGDRDMDGVAPSVASMKSALLSELSALTRAAEETAATRAKEAASAATIADEDSNSR